MAFAWNQINYGAFLHSCPTYHWKPFVCEITDCWIVGAKWVTVHVQGEPMLGYVSSIINHNTPSLRGIMGFPKWTSGWFFSKLDSRAENPISFLSWRPNFEISHAMCFLSLRVGHAAVWKMDMFDSNIIVRFCMRFHVQIQGRLRYARGLSVRAKMSKTCFANLC